MSDTRGLSHCHKAEVRVSTSGEGTSYYICELCQEPCDVWAGDTQSELDEILDAFASGEVSPHWKDNRKTYTKPEAKQAILDWHNKQVKAAKYAIYQSLHRSYVDTELDTETLVGAFQKDIEAERNKLKESR